LPLGVPAGPQVIEQAVKALVIEQIPADPYCFGIGLDRRGNPGGTGVTSHNFLNKLPSCITLGVLFEFP
ncbi:MAG TPA: hypothetical protein DCZ04_11630, partial [Syntrophorhabdus aromaticivorans]|nr:hypothetical protein [Syntrophorhabdus aromaticivorans]